ncbi:three component ABC system middle component [Pontibacter liquoris]|uniref:three component ABC system middle component n=1 Tax=Pontibacter liquoris TaxID=2905677 RepID=UPI001FA73122|nr:three component ABC system middle component [Pontibacter liquoris]
MKKTLDDIFAATNPIFCAVVLHYFLKGHHEAKEKGIDFPLMFLPVPILLSQDIMSTMVQTNKKTTFLNWIVANPIIRIGIGDRITNTTAITKSAIRFGLNNQLITITEDGKFLPNGEISDSKAKQLGIQNYTTIAQRFGSWIGNLDSPEAVFFALGITF